MKKRHLVILGLILFATFIFRFPSLYEPYWYGDEGIFAAVATKLNQGGILYQDAWDNKPPMIYLTYAAIFKLFGVSMFWLRLATIVVILSTTAVIYEIAQAVLGIKRALAAAFVFGFLSSLRIVEGNLSLTEIFMILPTTLAMLIVIKRNFDEKALFVAGILFAIASLYKQVGGLEAAALGVFLFLLSKSFGEFFRKCLFLTLGFLIPHLLTLGYFASKNLVGDYLFGAYTYYQIYLGESPQYALLINILKFLPILTAIIWSIFMKRRGELAIFHLFLLWTAFAFLGTYFSGRTYGHYLVQALPPVSLLLASISLKFDFKKIQIIFAIFFFIPLVFLTRFLFTDFLTGGPVNQINYFRNFIDYSLGRKNLDEYNNFFDKNINSIMAVRDFFAVNKLTGSSAYVWGDLPWLYATSNLRNPTRYVTSFHVFGVPGGREEVMTALFDDPPNFILKPQSAIGNFPELENLLAVNYTFVSQVETIEVYRASNLKGR